jgi:hypothetical protein
MKTMILTVSAGCALFWGAIAWLISQSLSVAAAVAIGALVFSVLGMSLVCSQHR